MIEEFLRKPNNFTPDLEEENAQMSDLGGGRASNGGARTGGPVPVPSGTPTGGMRTPRDIMRERTAREARRQEEQQKAEEARRMEERKRSAERRAATVPGAAPRLNQPSSQYAPNTGVQQGDYDGAGDIRRSDSGRVSGADVLGEPVSRTQEYPSTRTRGPSTSRQDYAQQQPAPQPTASGTRRTQQSQSQPRQPSGQSAAGASTSQSQQQSGDAGQRATSSSFPHAFERWETLSSHWEGLTSYWLHKLEQNTEEIRNTIPNASTLNRQITDLSAAGANLFHAVVELQRLRASSERKFQRWFFETRGESEKNSEVLGSMERQLKLERSAREEAANNRVAAEEAAMIARKELAEMRKELDISREEARRAWEELGRRNQDALDLADNLKNGRVGVVGGVQVVPYFGGPSRSGTGASQRPGTREGQQPGQYGSVAGASSAGAAGLASPGDEAEYYRERPSPTNTDPFTEQQQPPDKSSLAAGTYRPYPVASDPNIVQQGATASLPSQQRGASASAGRSQGASSGPPASAQEAQRFYQHGATETFLHSPPGSSSGGQTRSGGQTAPARREDVRSEASYADTMSEGDTEYAIDAGGNIQHDEQGRPIVFRRRMRSQEEESEDPYDEDAIRHERELAAHYRAQQQGYGGGEAGQQQGEGYAPEAGGILPEAPSVPSTSAQAMETYTPTTSGGATSGGTSGPDYEGSGYGGWENVQTTRHHHPTRLSDVLEEEEERSSRRSRTGTGD